MWSNIKRKCIKVYQRVAESPREARKCTKQSKAGGESGGERWCKAKKAKILQLQQADTQKGECAYAHVSIEQG